MSWKHLKDTTPKAAKQHKCILCGEPIEPGTTHVLRAGIMDGKFASHRIHTECEAARRAANDGPDDEEYIEGEMDRPGKEPKPEPSEGDSDHGDAEV